MRSRYIPFILMALVAVAIAVATVLPDSSAVYSTLWFRLLWAAIAVTSLWLMWRRRMWRRPVLFAMHLSLLVILLGALLTSLTSRGGMLHLRQGVPESQYLSQDTREAQPLPCTVRLDTFLIEYYPGTQAPLDYVSVITAEGSQQTIRMNRIGRLHRHRLYQTSYDPDLQGTILTVTYDPYGTPVTYAGYALFLLSFLLLLCHRRKVKN